MKDVVIIGAGPAGLFAAYELCKNKNLKITLLDKGKRAKNRVCPMKINGGKCLNCNPCNILSGFGGAGTFSDGKLNFIPKLGKSDLFKYMDSDEAFKIIDETEKIFNEFNMDSEIFPKNLDKAYQIQRDIAKTGARLLLIKQKHLGSDKLPNYINNFENYLEKKGIELLDDCNVLDIKSESCKLHEITYNKNNKEYKIKTKNVIVAPG